MKDASLDDFLGGGSSDDSTEEGDEPADGDEGETTDGDGGETAGGDEGGGSPPALDDASAGDGELAADGERTPTGSRIGPVTPTMEYAPDGTPCDGCDATVERRWRAESGRYCAACLEW